MIDINELRRLALDGDLAAMQEIILRLEAAEKERDFAKTEIARLHDDIRELTDERVLDEEDRERIVAHLQGDALRAALRHEADCVEAAKAEIDALRAKIAEMERQAPARLVTPTAYRWRYRGAIKWQYGELTEEVARLAKEHNHEVQSLYALPGAQPAPGAPWVSLAERMPNPDKHDRVLIYTEGYDFGGEQVFDVKAEALNECRYIDPDEQPETCKAASHWMPHPRNAIFDYAAHCAQPAPSVPTALLVAAANLVAQVEIVSRVGFIDTPSDKDSCAAFCVAEGTWLELMSAIESLASALAAAPEAKP